MHRTLQYDASVSSTWAAGGSTTMESDNWVDTGGLNGLSIVLKISERCNIACTYCYFFFAGDESYLRHPAVIPASTIDALCTFLIDAVERHGLRDLRIGLHGGEPLLLKKARFTAMCEQLHAAVGHRCRLVFSVQTNAMLVDDEWLEIFERFKVLIGVSFDGPKEIHDVSRLDKKGRGTYQATEDGWFRLQNAAAAKRIETPAILCVVAPQHSGSMIFDHLVGKLGTEHVNFLLPDVSHDSPQVSRQYVDGCGRFLIDVFNSWVKRGDAEVRVRFISEIFGPLVDDGYLRRSVLAKNSPYSQLIVSSSGEVSPDDTIRGLDERFRDTGLSITNQDIQTIWSSDLIKELNIAHMTPPDACRNCEWWNACKGGTPHHRYSIAAGFNNPSVFCGALKALHAHVFHHLTRAGYDADRMRERMAWRPNKLEGVAA